MKKRIISLMLVSAMMAGMLVGCGKTDDADVQTQESKVEESTSEKSEEEPEVEQEPVTVKILAKATAAVEQAGGYNWDAPAPKKLVEDLEEIGIRLEIEAVGETQFMDVVNARMASGTDMPDMISFTWEEGVQNLINDWADAGLVYELNGLLDEYDEDNSIRTYYSEKAPGVLQQVSAADGSLYWFSYLYNNRLKYDHVSGKEFMAQGLRNLCIRQDWVEAVGEEIKLTYTPDELAALLKKMQDEDANGNGKADEVAFLKIDDFENGFATAFGLHAVYNQPLFGYFEGEFEVFSNFYHENFPAYIEFMNALYENGVYDTEALSSTVQQMVSEERVSAAYGFPDFAYESSMINPDESKVLYKPIILDADGDETNGYYLNCDNNNGTPYCNYIIPTSNKNPEAVIRLMDYVYTDDYAILEEFGVMDKGVIMDETGHLEDITGEEDETKALWHYGLSPNALPCMCTVSTGVRMEVNEADSVWKQAKEEFKIHVQMDLWQNCYDQNMVMFTTATLTQPTDEENAFLLEHEALLTTYARELLTDLILGNKSIEDLPKYLEEMEELGYKEYLDIMQARLDRFVNFE